MASSTKHVTTSTSANALIENRKMGEDDAKMTAAGSKNGGDYINNRPDQGNESKVSDVKISTLDIESYKLEHINRIAHLRNVCLNYDVKRNEAFRASFEGSFMRSGNYNFTVCKVAKVGSTFWVQLMSVLEQGIEAGKSLFSKMRSRVHSATAALRTTRDRSRKERTILISRDPYSRIFSAYIDKIYLPIMFAMNYHIRHLPYDGRVLNENCPVDVTFQEFLEYTVNVAKRGGSYDHHWAPISAYCHPCEVKPFLLVKQESFAKDVEFVLHAVNVTQEENALILGALKGHRIDLTLPGLVETIYGYAKNINVRSCLGWLNVAERVWESFKIQGYVRRDVPFPSERFTSLNQYQSAEYLSRVILDIIRENPMSSTDSKQQRHEYLCRAYEDIPSDVINALQQIYQYDFLVYNYSTSPPCW